MPRLSLKPVTLSTLCLAGLLTQIACAQNSLLPQAQDDTWYDDGAAAVAMATGKTINNTPGAARNIILFIGDGMGVSTVSAARIFAGQQLGMTGEEYQLSFEKFPWTGLSKTYNTDAQVGDSAGTATAFMTGVKSRSGVINISSEPARGSCAEFMSADNAVLLSALEIAELAGKATGVVSTARITHATPATSYANSPDRDWESDADLPQEAIARGCTDIASQLLAFKPRLEAKINNGNPLAVIDGIDVVFGGGRRAFYSADPASLVGFAETAGAGRREDGRNLIQEWQDMGGVYVMDQAGFEAISDLETRNIMGLFESSHMRYEANRPEDENGEPSLTEMTTKAISLLQQDADGFFLQVEAGRVDHAHHANNAYNALSDAVELSRAVEAALAMVDLEETLIIVTADHSHVFTFAGYPDRGNPILGTAGNDILGNPYTTVGYYNGRGFNDSGDETDADTRAGLSLPGRNNLSGIDTTAPGFHQESLVALGSETHGGEDVGIYAIGPGAHLLSGTIEQNVIFHVMNHAGALVQQAADRR
jgi:alkaline phosphatase